MYRGRLAKRCTTVGSNFSKCAFLRNSRLFYLKRTATSSMHQHGSGRWARLCTEVGHYDPLMAGSIDGTDKIPHDRGIVRAMLAKCKTFPISILADFIIYCNH